MEHDARLHRLLFEADGNSIRWGGALRGREQAPATISACSRAILTHYGIDPSAPGEWAAGSIRAGIEIRDVQALDGHLTMTILLPMPWSGRRMTIATQEPATIRLPGMTLSPAIVAAALGRPVGRLAPHPALDACPELLVTRIEQGEDAGVNTAVLHFGDGAEALPRRLRAKGGTSH